MRRALRRVCQSLVAAGSLTGALPVAAQAPVPPPTTFAQAPAKGAAAATENPNRLAEIRVELAWLADPATFPYRLSARVEGVALRVSGCVPSAAARSQALKVARNHCLLPLRDELAIVPGLPPRQGVVAKAALQQSASAALESGFPTLAPILQVQCRGLGELVVSGAVPSHEVSLAVSQRLRQLDGCTSVVNYLQVNAEVIGPLTRLLETLNRAESAKTPTVRQAVHQAPEPAAMSSAKQPGDACASCGSPLPMLGRASEQALLPPPQPLAITDKAPPTAARVPTIPLALPPRTAAAPGPLPSAPLPQPAPTPQTNRVPAVATERPAVAPRPASASGVAQVQHSEAAPGTAGRGGPSYLQTRLRQRIEEACGSAVRDVDVVCTAPAEVLVRFKARSAPQAEELAARIMALPELASCKIDLEVKVQP
jgi:hypothetical protein